MAIDVSKLTEYMANLKIDLSSIYHQKEEGNTKLWNLYLFICIYYKHPKSLKSREKYLRKQVEDQCFERYKTLLKQVRGDLKQMNTYRIFMNLTIEIHMTSVQKLMCTLNTVLFISDRKICFPWFHFGFDLWQQLKFILKFMQKYHIPRLIKSKLKSLHYLTSGLII